MCDVLVLHGCLVVLSILPPLSFSSSLGVSGVLRGKQRAAKAMHCVCLCVCVLCERGEEEEERREGGSRQGQPRERERKGRRGEMSA